MFYVVCLIVTQMERFLTKNLQEFALTMGNIKKSDAPLKHPQAESLDEMELFRTFKKYDRNMNGTLDFNEYT